MTKKSSRQGVNFRAWELKHVFKTSFAFGNIEKNRDKKFLPFIERMKALTITGADSGFLERGFVCIIVPATRDQQCHEINQPEQFKTDKMTLNVRRIARYCSYAHRCCLSG